ncbi:MAG TPA: F0F1 ATP synthase subunit epsilon, partial [Rhodobacteraceae bacterium]|nr:F0F1 ATP synthase subunit epsilon [Paracoccaceae bacterium]
LVEEAKSAYGKAQEAFVNEPGPVDDAAKMLSDMVAVGDQMGLSGTR